MKGVYKLLGLIYRYGGFDAYRIPERHLYIRVRHELARGRACKQSGYRAALKTAPRGILKN